MSSRRIAVALSVAVALSAPPALASHPEKPTFSLGDPSFHASGRGDVTTIGSIAAGSNSLAVTDPATWEEGHGIRVERAGPTVPVHDGEDMPADSETADSDWMPAEGAAPAGTTVTYTDRKDGGQAAVCTLPPGSGPARTCEAGFRDPAIELGHDDLRFWVKPAVPLAAGELSMLVSLERADGTRADSFDLALPALVADWQEVFLELDRTLGSPRLQLPNASDTNKFLVLRCNSSCDALSVAVDDFTFVNDLITQVSRIPGTSFTLATAARRSVTDAMVYHDDTAAVGQWLRKAEVAGGANLFAPPGVYFVATQRDLYSDSHIFCGDPLQTTFKNTGRPKSGAATMFSTVGVPGVPHGITLENCGFDQNGYNRQDFNNVIVIMGQTLPEPNHEPAREITIHGNRFVDSDSPGKEGCELGQDPCPTRQRHYILVTDVDSLLIEDNHLQGGGRIKAGDPGWNMTIRGNTLDFVNDNGITIGMSPCVEGIPCTTENAEITDNVVTDGIFSGIYFGSDTFGEFEAGMTMRDVVVAHNEISGWMTGAGIQGWLPAGGAERVNVVDNTVTMLHPGHSGHFTSGIIVGNRGASPRGGTGIAVERNEVHVVGPGTRLLHAGLRFGGPISDLTMRDNLVACEGCLGVDQGVWFQQGVTDVRFTGNRVVNATGSGLRINDDFHGAIAGNEFIGSGPAAQITANLSAGQTMNATIQDNLVRDGLADGVRISGDGDFDVTLVGNTIRNNAGAGVAVLGDGPVTLTENSIHDNGGLGIDLGGKGVSPNDPLDADEGPNRGQNAPVIAAVERKGDGVVLHGTVETSPAGRITIELFKIDACDASGHGEGEAFLAVRIRGGVKPEGKAFKVAVRRLLPGTVISATATDDAGNTSELSACVTVP